jgi:WD40 repeat protein
MVNKNLPLMKQALTALAIMVFTHCFAQQVKLVLPVGHTGNLTNASFNPDGSKAITSADDKTVKIWDTYTGALLADLKEHSSYISSAEFSPDGKKILTASGDKTIKIWDAESGKLLLNLTGHLENINTAHFSPSGKKIISIASDNCAIVWDSHSGKRLFTLYQQGPMFSGPGITVGRFSADETTIITGDNKGVIKTWNAETGEPLMQLMGHNTHINDICFDAAGNQIASMAQDSGIIIWDAVTGKKKLSIPLKTFIIGNTISFSPNNNYLLASTFTSTTVYETKNFTKQYELKGTIHLNEGINFSSPLNKSFLLIDENDLLLINLQTGKEILRLKGHSSSIKAASFSADGKMIITGSHDQTARLWDAFTGKLLQELSGKSSQVKFAAFGKTDDEIIGVYADHCLRIWDSKKAAFKETVVRNTSPFTAYALSPDKKRIIAGSQDGSLIFWDYDKEKKPLTVKKHSGKVNSIEFNNDGTRFISSSDDSTGIVWNTANGQLIHILKGHAGPLMHAAISYDGNKAITASFGMGAKLWNLHTGQLISNLGNPGGLCMQTSFSPDGKRIIIAAFDNVLLFDSLGNFIAQTEKIQAVRISFAKFSPDGNYLIVVFKNNIPGLYAYALNLATGIPVILKGHKAQINNLAFSSDGKKLLTASEDKTIICWDYTTGKVLNSFNGHNNSVNVVRFSKDDQYIVSASDDNFLKVWKVDDGKLIYSIAAINNTDYIILRPDGYYKCTPDAAKQLYYIDESNNKIGFTQLDIRYNRPDLILQAENTGDSIMVVAYRAAYFKRLKALGIDSNFIHSNYPLPVTEIVNRSAFKSATNAAIISLHIKFTDNIHFLNSFNVWINEVPLFGKKGRPIFNSSLHQLDTTISVALSEGMNQIEVSVLNSRGIESYRTPLYVKFNPPVPGKSKLWFIGIGMDKFENSSYNLAYSKKDIRDLARAFALKYKNELMIDTLFDKSVNKFSINALKEKLLQSEMDDIVVIAYSGHGLLSKKLDYYLSTYNVNFNAAEENGLPYEMLEGLLDNIPARKKLMLIDACHSGEVDKDEALQINATAASMGLSKGVKPLTTVKKQLGLTNSFELMQNLFVNVGKSTGAIIISAAAGTQFALERKDLKNGVFTFSILEYLKQQQQVSVSGLKNYVNKRVIQLTNGLQVPTTRADIKSVDWKL